MMPLSPYRTPFAPGGTNEVDASLASRLISVALASGGDYADLFFEYRSIGHFLYEDGCLKSASRRESLGLGVRVRKGDACRAGGSRPSIPLRFANPEP
jgi:TldD protein